MTYKFEKQRKSKYRNKPCPCGSGKKFKKCCWDKEIDFLHAREIKEIRDEIKVNKRKIKENDKKIIEYTQKIEENSHPEETTKINERISQKKIPITLGWGGRTKDEIIKQLKYLVYNDGEYPYVVEEREDYVEVHSICKHGVCRSGNVASPLDIENLNGLWDSN